MKIRLQRGLYRWILKINGGNQGWNYSKQQATRHAFSLRLYLHPAPHGNVITIGNAHGVFDENGQFQLTEWIRDEILRRMLSFGDQKIALDNLPLNNELGNPFVALPEFLSEWAKTKLEIENTGSVPLSLMMRGDYCYIRVVILADYVALQLEEIITEKFKTEV